jgi:glycosyltransferase involved in cell wall biosynthesis/GT2 family glycosyltransferase
VSEREVSIVVCTDARLPYLKTTLLALSYLEYRAYEVCLVCGPTEDGTRSFAAAHSPALKIAHCPARNLSQARNLGIALASGEIVAFLDDDAVPEPEWLADLNQAYEDPEVAAAGGIVYDGSGVSLQTRFATIDRLGRSYSLWDRPTPNLNFPFSPEFPHLLGANCSFRRAALLALGGFDEEYEYFLDESDLVARVNDAGLRIAQLPRAAVHHRPAPSPMRRSTRITRQWRPLIKNRVYFGLRHALGAYSRWDVLRNAIDEAANWEKEVARQVAEGALAPEDLERFVREAESGVEAGQAAARLPPKLMRAPAAPAPFLPFAVAPPRARLCLCLVTQDYPPGQNGGIARHVAEVATEWARLGHHVHVLTRASEGPTVGFEDGVWVHRLDIDDAIGPPPDLVAPHEIPRELWGWSRTAFEAAAKLDATRPINLVYAPLWDAEPMAFVHAPRFPLMVALQTTLDFWLDSQPACRADPKWMAARGAPLLALERWILERSPRLHANSRAILIDICERYRVGIDDERVALVPHGLSDWKAAAAVAERDRFSPLPPTAASPGLRFLFVGRLESRKGIDTLLAAAPEALRRLPGARLDIVGDFKIERAEGGTYRAAFLADPSHLDLRDRIVFHGRVEEAELRRFYARCDVLVAPSRYESFGLIYLEGMVFGKPVIGGRGGGGPEVIEEGVTGLLIDPGDVEGLTAAMLRLAEDAALRRAMGEAGRRRYEAEFRTGPTAARLLQAGLTRS